MDFVIDNDGDICVVQYKTKKGPSYSKKKENYYPHSSFPPPPHANNDPIFSMKFQRMATFHFRGGGVHFLATLNFIYGPLNTFQTFIFMNFYACKWNKSDAELFKDNYLYRLNIKNLCT